MQLCSTHPQHTSKIISEFIEDMKKFCFKTRRRFPTKNLPKTMKMDGGCAWRSLSLRIRFTIILPTYKSLKKKFYIFWLKRCMHCPSLLCVLHVLLTDLIILDFIILNNIQWGVQIMKLLTIQLGWILISILYITQVYFLWVMLVVDYIASNDRVINEWWINLCGF
jgi:hypothetical protein